MAVVTNRGTSQIQTTSIS